MLVFIKGGPEEFADKAFESEILLNTGQFPTDQYRWTSETIRSVRFPDKVAQVWQHVSLEATPAQVGTSPVQTAAENPNSTAAGGTTREVDTEVAVATSSPASATSESPGQALDTSQNALVTAQMYREAEASVRLDGETQTFEPDYTGPAVEVGDEGDLPDGEQLFLRRKRLKITVQEAADATGLATSKISAIEKGTGKRIRPGEVQTLHDYLTGREAGGPPRV